VKAVAEVTPVDAGAFLRQDVEIKERKKGRPKKSMVHENPFTGKVEVLDGD
jgi:hypothetical protein